MLSRHSTDVVSRRGPALMINTRLLADLLAVGDFLVESPNESGRHHWLIAAGAERIGPLTIRQARQQVARPAHVTRSDPAEELFVPAVIAELHESVLDP